MKKFLITSTIAFEVEADSGDMAAIKAHQAITAGTKPERIDVWHEDGSKQFADRYTFAPTPRLIQYTKGQPATVQISETEQTLVDGTPYTPPVTQSLGQIA